MPGKFRKERVGELLHEFVADEIRRMQDPRLYLVTITAVDIAPDLKNAKIFWTVPNINPEDPGVQRRDEVQKALQGCAPFLRRRVGVEMKLRYTPELRFHYDESIERASRIDSLLHQIKANEGQHGE